LGGYRVAAGGTTAAQRLINASKNSTAERICMVYMSGQVVRPGVLNFCSWESHIILAFRQLSMRDCRGLLPLRFAKQGNRERVHPGLAVRSHQNLSLRNYICLLPAQRWDSTGKREMSCQPVSLDFSIVLILEWPHYDLSNRQEWTTRLMKAWILTRSDLDFQVATWSSIWNTAR
jgi:hypothetical protein